MQLSPSPLAASPGALLGPAGSAEDAVFGTLMSLGRRMRMRAPGDTIEFALLGVLRSLSSCGPLRLSSLAQSMQLDASTVSRHVKQLEDRGLLERTTDPDDGRASLLTLTDDGREAFLDHVARRKALIAEALQGWSEPDRDRLRKLLERLNQQISPGLDQAPGPDPAVGA